MKENEITIPIAMAANLKNREGKDIKIDRTLFFLTQDNKGIYQSPKQKWLFIKSAERSGTPLSEFKFGYQQDKVKKKLLEKIIDTDKVIIYQPCTWKDTHDHFWHIYILDEDGVRVQLMASWVWKDFTPTPRQYDPKWYDRMYEWSREKNAGLIEKNQKFKFYRIITRFERK